MDTNTKLDLASRKIAFIREHINAGRRAYVSTVYRATAFRTLAQVDLALRANHRGLELREGKRWVDANYCRISAE